MMLEQSRMDTMNEKLTFDIVSETSMKKSISVAIPDSLISIIREMCEKIENLETEVKKLEEELFLTKEERENSLIRIFAIHNALEDKDWVEPHELFKF